VAWLGPRVRPDKWTPPDRKDYTVHSVYFDTCDLDFYYEKLAGIKLRKKVRIRGYEHGNQRRDLFLEIKRKYGNLVYKDRALVKMGHLEPLLDSGRPGDVLPNARARDLEVIGMFLHNLKARALRPVVLITYEREALIGETDPSVRVTFDRNVRCRFLPEVEDIYSEGDWDGASASETIMEIKFNGAMPYWLRHMTWAFGISPLAISKYCRSIDACSDFACESSVRLLRLHGV